MNDEKNTPRRIGYIYHGKGTPSILEQEKALMDSECHYTLTDAAPVRDERALLIDHAALEGDTIVICKTSLIGSGKDDTANAVRALGAKGVMIEVLGCGERLYTSESDIRNFAALALKTSRRINAKAMTERRARAGRPSKLEALTDGEWSILELVWFHDGAKQRVAIDLCNSADGFNLDGVTRENIAQAIKARQIRKALDQAKADDTPLEQVEVDDGI